MSAIEVTDDNEIIRAAYWHAWEEYQYMPQTPDERRSGPQRLQEHIRLLVEGGERDTAQIAAKALGTLRQTEQNARSKARVMSAADATAAN